MDILSFFRKSPEKQIGKLRKKVKEPHGDASVRINAAYKLYEMRTPASLLALLERFNISVSPSRQDEEEKDQVFGWFVSLGKEAVDPILTFLRRERQVYWPVRILKEILAEEALVQKLNELLRFHWENPPASPEPQAQLLKAIQNVRAPELEETVALYLEERDDDIRIGAIDYLFQSDNEEGFREPIIESYLDSEDRPRIRAHILEGFVNKGWSVKGFRPRIEETLPARFALNRDGRIRRVGVQS